MNEKTASESPANNTSFLGTLLIYVKFIFGNRRAIERLAATPKLWLVGLWLACTAGFAREYDAEYLIAEPWHLLLAPVASGIAASGLWFIISLSGFGHWRNNQIGEGQPPTHKTADHLYLPFLGLFWLTAPLAWAYAIPYEQFLPELAAAQWNIYSLMIIAVWRVVLIIRVIHVLCAVKVIPAATIVLFASTIIFFALTLLWDRPAFVIMGGVRLTGVEAFESGLKQMGLILSLFGLPVLCIAWLIILAQFRGDPWNSALNGLPVKRTPLIAMSIPVVGILLIACQWFQPQQHKRWEIENALQNGEIAHAIDLLNKHYPQDTPLYWDPPPRYYDRRTKIDPLDVLMTGLEHPMSPVVLALYEKKLLQTEWFFLYQYKRSNTYNKLIDYLERSPNAARLLDATNVNYQSLRHILEGYNKATPQEKKRIDALLQRFP
jgi:hypothetical protein